MITVATYQKSYQEDKPVWAKAAPEAVELHGSYQLLENRNYLECRNLENCVFGLKSNLRPLTQNLS